MQAKRKIMGNTEVAKPFDADGFFKSVVNKDPNLRRIPEYDAVGNFEGIQAVTFDSIEYNGTTYAVYELTDYIDEIRENAVNGNCFTVACYDYALNQAVYEIDLPDSYLAFYFEETELPLSPNEVYKLEPLAYPGTEWSELLEYYSSNSNTKSRKAIRKWICCMQSIIAKTIS